MSSWLLQLIAYALSEEFSNCKTDKRHTGKNQFYYRIFVSVAFSSLVLYLRGDDFVEGLCVVLSCLIVFVCFYFHNNSS